MSLSKEIPINYLFDKSQSMQSYKNTLKQQQYTHTSYTWSCKGQWCVQLIHLIMQSHNHDIIKKITFILKNMYIQKKDGLYNGINW